MTTRHSPCHDTRLAIILAGGRGTRLAGMTARLTGRPMPKQFCAFTPGGPTLLQRTAERARAVAPGTLRVVVPCAHHAIAEEQLAAYAPLRLLTQPADRGTALGLLLALADVAVDTPDAEVLVLPADHGFSDEDLVEDTIEAAFAAVREVPERVVLLAAQADRAATDYGWVVPERGRRATGCPVARLVEKPDAATAARLLAAGCAWSTMMMAATVGGMLELFRRRFPILVRMFLHHAMLPAAAQPVFLDRAYRGLRAIDLSADVLAQAEPLCMIELPRAAGWSDLGTEDRMRAWLRATGSKTPAPRSGVRAAVRGQRAQQVGA